MARIQRLFYTTSCHCEAQGKLFSWEEGHLSIWKCHGCSQVKSSVWAFWHVNNSLFCTFFVIDIVSVTVHFLISLVFPVDCSYLNVWDLAWGKIDLNGTGWRRKWASFWRSPLMVWNSTTEQLQNPGKVTEYLQAGCCGSTREEKLIAVGSWLFIGSLDSTLREGGEKQTNRHCGHSDCSSTRGTTCASRSCTAEEIQDKINLLQERWRGNKALTTEGAEIWPDPSAQVICEIWEKISAASWVSNQD